MEKFKGLISIIYAFNGFGLYKSWRGDLLSQAIDDMFNLHFIVMSLACLPFCVLCFEINKESITFSFISTKNWF